MSRNQTRLGKIFLGVKAERAKWEIPGLTTRWATPERGRSQHSYEVEGDLDGVSDEQLIQHCDGGARNYGGRVTREEGKAQVIVYVD